MPFQKGHLSYIKKQGFYGLCKICNKKFYIFPYRIKIAKYCSYKCYGISKKGKSSWNKGKKMSKEFKQKCSIRQKSRIPWNKNKKFPQFQGENSCHWKGGRIIDVDGYIQIYNPSHPFCNNKKYVREHRFIVEKQIGRYLQPKEQIHHLGIKYPINSIQNKQDNRPQNLMAFINKSAHNRFEQNCPVKPEEIIFDGRKFHH